MKNNHILMILILFSICIGFVYLYHTQITKRSVSDKYYFEKIKSYTFDYHKEIVESQKMFFIYCIGTTKDEMYKDGYSHAQAGIISDNAMSAGYKEWKDTWYR